jgi:Flp pilus assembly protein TadD
VGATVWARGARGVLATCICVLGLEVTACHSARTDTSSDAHVADVTFARNVAPIVFRNCVPCHHSDGVAPFSLVTYNEVRTRAHQIGLVVANHSMPPWLPVPGYGTFEHERGLTEDEIGTIERWIESGARPGNAAEMPAAPHWSDGWALGPPDMTLSMPIAYTLRADAGETFRNFVIPIPLVIRRYVRAIEFHPGNTKSVHHAVFGIDKTGASRRLERGETDPGYPGMFAEEVGGPRGHVLGWTPGKTPTVEPDDLAWELDPGDSLILQLHIIPTGKVETIQSTVGLFFASRQPSRVPFLFRLGTKDIDIQPGVKKYVVGDSYRLPVAVDVLSIYPHAHLLAKDMKAWATLPDGTTKWLLWIDHWNFKWQDQYRYLTPMTLPAGTTIDMQFTYDNSADNPAVLTRPQVVSYGPRSSDEMCDLWIQVVPRNDRDLAILNTDYTRRRSESEVNALLRRIAREPMNVALRTLIASQYLLLGRADDAIVHLNVALSLKPDLKEAQNDLGTALELKGELALAITHFKQALDSNGEDADVLVNLGLALDAAGEVDDAMRYLRNALRQRPDMELAERALGTILGASGSRDESLSHLKRAVQLDPLDAEAQNNLGVALAQQGDRASAIAHLQRALEIRPDYVDAKENIAALGGKRQQK